MICAFIWCYKIFGLGEDVLILSSFYFSSDFIGEDELNCIIAKEIYSFNDVLIMFFMCDPFEEN